MLRIGYHVSISGSLDLAFDRARKIGCTCMQIFPSNPRSWAMKALEKGEVDRFRAKGKSFGISPVFAHMPYLHNLASPKEDVYCKSVEALGDVAKRCETLGIEYLIAHLGSNLGTDEEEAFERVVESVRVAGRAAPRTRILLENEAGQRNSVGSKLEDLVALYNRIGIRNLGFCVDTCHLFAAGYDIGKSEVAEEVAGTLGSSRIHAIHLNDAKHPLGSGLDRHENIGFGYIGRQGFETFFRCEGMKTKPIILETPGLRAGVGELKLVEKILKN
jgi:deoxyribonuclease-4